MRLTGTPTQHKVIMSFASRHNKQSFGIDTKDFKFVKLEEIFNSKENGGKDVIHDCNGLWVHKSQLGDSPVIIDAANKQLVNLPNHMAEEVREILASEEDVNDIKNGKVGYTIYDYDSHGKKCYSIHWVDK